MIAETIRDFLPLLNQNPAMKVRNKPEELAAHQKLLKERWNFVGSRLEHILEINTNPLYLVGECPFTRCDAVCFIVCVHVLVLCYVMFGCLYLFGLIQVNK